jgi:hypothetical protein
MNNTNKRWAFRAVGIIFLLAAALFGWNVLQGNSSAVGSVALNLVIAGLFFYLSVRPLPNDK